MYEREGPLCVNRGGCLHRLPSPLLFFGQNPLNGSAGEEGRSIRPADDAQPLPYCWQIIFCPFELHNFTQNTVLFFLNHKRPNFFFIVLQQAQIHSDSSKTYHCVKTHSWNTLATDNRYSNTRQTPTLRPTDVATYKHPQGPTTHSVPCIPEYDHSRQKPLLVLNCCHWICLFVHIKCPPVLSKTQAKLLRTGLHPSLLLGQVSWHFCTQLVTGNLRAGPDVMMLNGDFNAFFETEFLPQWCL